MKIGDYIYDREISYIGKIFQIKNNIYKINITRGILYNKYKLCNIEWTCYKSEAIKIKNKKHFYSIKNKIPFIKNKIEEVDNTDYKDLSIYHKIIAV